MVVPDAFSGFLAVDVHENVFSLLERKCLGSFLLDLAEP